MNKDVFYEVNKYIDFEILLLLDAKCSTEIVRAAYHRFLLQADFKTVHTVVRWLLDNRWDYVHVLYEQESIALLRGAYEKFLEIKPKDYTVKCQFETLVFDYDYIS